MPKVLDKIKKRVGKMFNRGTDMMLLVLIAVVIVLFTGAFNYLVEYVTEKSVVEKSVEAWNYAYTDDAKYYPEEDKLRLANRLQPLDTKKQGRYLYLTKSIPAADKDQVLKIKTDFSAIKIIINGEDAYNNRFGRSKYAGNAYNAVVIAASAKATDVDIFMEVPLSVGFEATISDGSNTVIENNVGLYVGGIIALLSLVYIVAVLFSSVKKKKNAIWALRVIPLFLCGIVIIIYKTAFSTYLLNDPRFFSLVSAAPAVLICLVLCGSYFNLKDKKKRLVPLLSALELLLVVSSVIVPDLLVSRIVISSVWALNAVIAFVMCSEIKKDIKSRVQHAETFFTMTLYIGLISVLLGILFNVRANNSYIFISSFAVILNLCIIFFIVYSWDRTLKNIEVFKQESAVYGDGITEIAKFFSKIVNCKNLDEFFSTSMEGLVDLTVSCTGDKREEIIYCLAEKKADKNEYIEIVNHGIEDCNYRLVDRFYNDTVQFCNISDTYFDIVLLLEGDVRLIYHIENITNGTKSFLNSIINTAFFGMEKAYIGFFSSLKTGNKQDVLVALAERAEKDDGYAQNHLTNVAKITKEICLLLGIDEKTSETVSQAAKLHDIGKIAIPYGIINKKDHLSIEEIEIIKQHAAYGYKILKGFNEDFTDLAARIALDHHERYDGNGYYGKAGEDIDRYARIVTVADVADALLSKRPYKAAWTFEAVHDYINSNSGKIFDPVVVDGWNKYYRSLKENEDE